MRNGVGEESPLKVHEKGMLLYHSYVPHVFPIPGLIPALVLMSPSESGI